MATVKPTIQRVGDNAARITWVLTNADSDGAPVGNSFNDFFDRSVQVSGAFGGAAVAIQGSNDGGSTWFAIDDPQGGDLAFWAAGGKAISEVPLLMRPLLTGGASSAVTVSLFARRARSGRAT